jgi:hypothetical protein
VPKLIPDAMVKQLTWEDQWIAYDDQETISMKIREADKLCLGGTMIWAIDYKNDDHDSVVYIGTEVYTERVAQCTAPCIMVIAPKPLIEPTTISIPPYTTSIEVGHPTNNNGITEFVVTTTTVVLSLAPVTTDKIPVSNIKVSPGQEGSVFYPSPSINLPPQTIQVTGADGSATPRLVILPPWPDMTSGPPDRWSNKPDIWAMAAHTTPIPTSSYTKPPVVLHCPPNTAYIGEYNARITLDSECSGITTLGWGCVPTRTVPIDANTDTSFILGCTMWTGTGAPLPTWTTWPPGELVWVEEEVSEPDDDGRTPCRLWFFWVKIALTPD